jgi:hypothetical protein
MSKPEKSNEERLVEENATKRQDRRTPHCLLSHYVFVLPQYSIVVE